MHTVKSAVVWFIVGLSLAGCAGGDRLPCPTTFDPACVGPPPSLTVSVQFRGYDSRRVTVDGKPAVKPKRARKAATRGRA
jgi:hypothetical protein